MKLIDQVDDVKIYQKVNNELIMRMCGGTETHSTFDKDSIFVLPLKEHYWNYFSIIPLCIDVKKILIIGLGCGTLSRQLLTLFPNVQIDGIECDQRVLDFGKKYFELERNNLNIIKELGDDFIKNTKNKYDFIILDAFEGALLAKSCLTDEFFDNVKRVLTENGVFGVNYIEEESIPATVRKQLIRYFSIVHKIPIPDSMNFVMFGSDNDLELNNEIKSEELKTLIKYVQQEVSHVKGSTRCKLQKLSTRIG